MDVGGVSLWVMSVLWNMEMRKIALNIVFILYVFGVLQFEVT